MKEKTVADAIDKNGSQVERGNILRLTRVEMFNPTTLEWQNEYEGIGLCLKVNMSPWRYSEPVIQVLADDNKMYNITMTAARKSVEIVKTPPTPGENTCPP